MVQQLSIYISSKAHTQMSSRLDADNELICVQCTHPARLLFVKQSFDECVLSTSKLKYIKPAASMLIHIWLYQRIIKYKPFFASLLFVGLSLRCCPFSNETKKRKTENVTRKKQAVCARTYVRTECAVYHCLLTKHNLSAQDNFKRINYNT